MTSRTLPVALASILLFAACGGSSDSSDDVADQVLEQNGINVDELLDDDGDLDLGDIAELESDTNDAIDSLANASGAATITIDGAAYSVTDATCFAFGDDLTLDGAGTGPDGQSFWGSVSYTVNDRAEMLESGVFDEAFLEQMFGDRQTAVDMSVEVEVGKTDRFEQAPDGLPDFQADIFMDSAMFGEISYEKSGNTISGSGDMTDGNGVAVGYSELVPFEFTASCS